MKHLKFLDRRTASGEEWIPVQLARLQLEHKNSCPLTAAGCTFRISYADMDLKSHILGHTLEDRYRHRASIAIPCQKLKLDPFQNEVIDQGRLVCPWSYIGHSNYDLCNGRVAITRYNGRFLDLAEHLVIYHSRLHQANIWDNNAYQHLKIAFFLTYSDGELFKRNHIYHLVNQLVNHIDSSPRYDATTIDVLHYLTKILSNEPTRRLAKF